MIGHIQLMSRPNLYPEMVAFHGYRYSPTKEHTPDKYMDFIYIKPIGNGCEIMVIYDNMVDHPDEECWGYGEIHIIDWEIDIKQIEICDTDISMAKLMSL